MLGARCRIACGSKLFYGPRQGRFGPRRAHTSPNYEPCTASPDIATRFRRWRRILLRRPDGRKRDRRSFSHHSDCLVTHGKTSLNITRTICRYCVHEVKLHRACAPVASDDFDACREQAANLRTGGRTGAEDCRTFRVTRKAPCPTVCVYVSIHP